MTTIPEEEWARLLATAYEAGALAGGGLELVGLRHLLRAEARVSHLLGEQPWAEALLLHYQDLRYRYTSRCNFPRE